jgi:E3 ubiquitin-protein ligase UBR4
MQGYVHKPDEVLAVYVLNKRVSVVWRGPQSSSRTERCFSSSSNMTVVHPTCHAEAARCERSFKVPRQEWEGATLRNQNTPCNNMLPLMGPQTPAHMYAEIAERYWVTLAQLGRHEGSRFRMIVHDVRVLLWRLACGDNFISDGGGSRLSNVRLLPHLLYMGYHCLGAASSSMWRLASRSLGQRIEAEQRGMIELSADRPDYFLVSP